MNLNQVNMVPSDDQTIMINPLKEASDMQLTRLVLVLNCYFMINIVIYIL